MLVTSWPAVSHGAADGTQCAELTFSFSLKCIWCVQLWQTGPVWCPEAPVPIALHQISSSGPLSPPSHEICYFPNVWSPNTMLRALRAGCFLGGTLSATVTQILCVLEYSGEIELHTGYMWKCTQEVPHLSFHLLVVTSLEAVNWKNGHIFFSADSSGLLQSNPLGNDLWDCGLKWHLITHSAIDLDVWTWSKQRN